jgi:phospholipid transport system substrate-binding protein
MGNHDDGMIAPQYAKNPMTPRLLQCLALFVLLAAAAGPSAAAEGPSAVIGKLNQTLLEVMRQAEVLGAHGRYDRLETPLRESFDFPRMASIAAGRHWQGLGPAQKRRLEEAFARMSIATFAARFDGYSGERFVIEGEEESLRGAVLVRSHLIKADGEAVAIDYLLSRRDATWRIIDVFLEATVSELATRRAEYGAVLANEDLEALLRRIDERAEALLRPRG